MKLIKELVDMIEDELEGAEHYAKFAIQHKSDHPSLANALYEISIQEMHHVSVLHEEIVKVIKAYRDKHGDPPAAMQAVYDWQHEKQIEESKEVKMLQAHYRDNA